MDKGKIRLDKSSIDQIIEISKHCREITDYMQILQTVTNDKDMFEKVFNRIQDHFNKLKKLKLDNPKYK